MPSVNLFFYNYLVIGLAILALTALIHPVQAIAIGVVVVTGVILYIMFPEEYKLTDSFYITTTAKHVIMVMLLFFLLTVVHVLTMLFFFCMIFMPVIFLHPFCREHSASMMTTI